jgi:purine-nucleoside phosphorylase
MDYDLMEQAVEKIRTTWPDAKPSCGLILGSGWSDVVESFEVKGSLGYEDIPGLGKTGVVGHAGKLAWGTCAGLETLIFQGRRHFYEGEGWTPPSIPVFALKQLGVKTVVLTNAAGVIKEGLKPGDLMVIDDHINNIPSNPLMGPSHEAWGPRFPDQSEVYTASLREKLDQAAAAIELKIHHGVYLASSGPPYETPAEIRRYKTVGADAVGMSTVPEALLASAAGLNVAGISCCTNFAAGISPHALSHEEVTGATREAMPRMKKLLAAFWEEMARS